MNQGQGDKRNWHVDKGIPVAIIMGLLLQSATAVWWAASISARVDNLQERLQVAANTQAALDRRQDEMINASETRIVLRLDNLGLKLDHLMEERRGR